VTVRSSNPVLTRLGEPATQRPAGYGSPAARYPQAGYQEPGYPGPGRPYPSTGPVVRPDERAMTIDDVVVRTAGLLGLTGLSAALAWVLVPDRYLFPAWIAAAMIGLVVGLVIAFRQVTNPVPIALYAVVEGVFVGLVSKYYESAYQGIVLQAVAATFGVFFLMTMLYKARVIRATPKFVRGVLGALVGAVALMAINLVLSLFGVNTHLRDGSGLAILFSIAMIVIASLTFILDFDQVERAVHTGMPERYAWSCAFGILVGLIWLYLEVLRLLGYLRGND
jgi:uncharacterized YccA/Bax inhibitor family protein